MKLTLIIIGCILLSVILKAVVYFFAAEDHEYDENEEPTFKTIYNTILVMVVTSIIPFVLGCAVGLYAIS